MNKGKKRTVQQVEKWFRKRKGKFLYTNGSKQIWMRSNWEILFATHLESCGLTWYYEPYCIRLPIGDYFPDFYVREWDCWIEIKGRMSRRAAQKIKEFKQLYSEDKLILLQKRDLEKLGVLPIIQKTNA